MEVYTTHISLLERLGRDHADRDAWIEFTARYGDLIRSFCRRRGLSRTDSDDVLQDVLLGLTRSMPGFRYDPGRGKFRSYLKTVTLHAIFRTLRQEPAGTTLRDAQQSMDDACAHGADDQWESEWRQYHLKLAMKRLSSEFNETHLSAFSRYALDGDDAADVATGLGISVDVVYQVKSRILRRLTECIAEQVAEEG